MADRDGRSRLSAFAAGNMPAPEPDRLGMLAESGQRRSSNVEDMAHIQMLEPRYLAVADLPGVADTASIGLRRMARPWRYRDISDVLGEISSLLPTQRIPPMPSLPAAPRTAGYALGGDVDPDATRGDMRDREDAVAFYVTPAQARTLADAGLIQSGAWGSPEALDRANLRQDMTDADRARAWRETGWAIHHGQPRTWVDAPLGLSPRHAAPFSRGEFVGGSLDDVLSGRGVDVMRALGLGDLPIEIRKGSEAMGGTRQYSDTGKAARIFGVAPDRSSLSDLLNHEGQHAVDMAEHPIEDPYANPIAGTRAENIFRAASGRTLPSGISADDMAQSAPETASYLRSSHEDRARDNTIRQRDPKRFRNVPPGQIDTYSEDAWPGRRFDGAFGVKLRDYDPNRRFASGGAVDAPATATLDWLDKLFLGGLSGAEWLGLGGTPLKLYNDVIQRGRKEPITEKDFPHRELAAYRDLVLKKARDTGRSEGNIDYPDYVGTGLPQGSLGGFRYRVTDDGNVAITDRYDFNANRGAPTDQNMAVRALGALFAPMHAAAAVGRKVAPSGKGVPVNMLIDGRGHNDSIPVQRKEDPTLEDILNLYAKD